MLGFGDNDDDQRMWNFLVFNFYGTDKELDEAGPVFVIIMIIVIIIGLIWWLCS